MTFRPRTFPAGSRALHTRRSRNAASARDHINRSVQYRGHLFFFWVYLLFRDLMVATFATAFLTLSQFFLFFPGVTHTFPYEFCFFNLTMFLYMLYLTSNRTLYLLGALVAMFLTCMNYWLYYLSSSIIMLGLWWQYRGRPGFKEVAMISAPPVAAASLTVGMVMGLFGLKAGALRLVDIFLARTIDARLAGGKWYPDQRFSGPPTGCITIDD